MIAMRRAIPILLVSSLWLACASTLPRPTDDQAVVAARRWPGTTRADLERGREVYVDRCSGCHALFQPQRFPASKWQRMVGEMSKRAKLEGRDRDVILRYLVSFAKPEPDGSSATQ